MCSSTTVLGVFFATFCVVTAFAVSDSLVEDLDGNLIVFPNVETPENDARGSFSSHIVALRPDYTFWKMVNVLRSMFDARTAEKRRSNREIDRPVQPELRSRRLLLNFGDYRR
ncbi:unnamed protein product [Caenorhabditis auriculariae]|uniref:Uncharacterized protein n=1 Tax=Caenorhabditis auriculariae TaxID=2777116 RepID=A0A8S1HDZ2_9PELO|nr:unnamed protein product [Caenorhabditis auriculariae]